MCFSIYILPICAYYVLPLSVIPRKYYANLCISLAGILLGCNNIQNSPNIYIYIYVCTHTHMFDVSFVNCFNTWTIMDSN